MWIRSLAFIAAFALATAPAAALQSPAAEDLRQLSATPATAPGSDAAIAIQTAQVVTLPKCSPGQIC